MNALGIPHDDGKCWVGYGEIFKDNPQIDYTEPNEDRTVRVSDIRSSNLQASVNVLKRDWSRKSISEVKEYFAATD